MFQYQVLKSTTLLEALEIFFPDTTKTTLRSWLKESRVLVNGKVEKIAKKPLQSGQKISIKQRAKVIEEGIEILYEDPHLVFIQKPAGLLTVSTAFQKGKTAHAILKRFYRKPVYVVHRLDQETSGVLLFALTEEALHKLKKVFKSHAIERRYVAIVHGTLPNEQGTWNSYLYEDSCYFVRSVPKEFPEAKLAITHYKVEGTKNHYSWLDISLETGKKNQIRAHCLEALHPVVGDKKYTLSEFKEKPFQRLLLHAYLLSLEHPITGAPLHILSEIPSLFYRFIKKDHPHA